MSFLKKQSGFTLVETLLAIGISTGAAMIVYKVLGESQKGQMMVENRDDINQIHREIVGKFTNRQACAYTLQAAILKKDPEFKLNQIFNDAGKEIIKIPHHYGKVKLDTLTVRNIDVSKNQAEIAADYSHVVAGKENKTEKMFRVELSFNRDKVFDGCISRGTLGLDPKEACDLVVGYNHEGGSYFFNGKCNFPQAACEQSQRVWNTEQQKCNFSEEDLEALRREICQTLSFEYSPETSRCLPSQELIKAAEEFYKKNNQ